MESEDFVINKEVHAVEMESLFQDNGKRRKVDFCQIKQVQLLSEFGTFKIRTHPKYGQFRVIFDY